RRYGGQGIPGEESGRIWYYPYKAVAAEWRGRFTPDDIEIAEGERFSQGSLNFYVSDKLEDGGYRMICETEGASGNDSNGTMVPINYVPGLATAQLTELLTPGNDEEETEAFRKRYLAAVRKPSTSGNVYDYYTGRWSAMEWERRRCFPWLMVPGR
ncbi:hypothetical protein CRH03_25260, partial [Clostridium sp. HMb25]